MIDMETTICPDCNGSGTVVGTTQGCCGCYNPDGSCCGMSIPEPIQEQCIMCGATGKIPVSPSDDKTAEPEESVEQIFGGLKELIMDDEIYEWYLELIRQREISFYNKAIEEARTILFDEERTAQEKVIDLKKLLHP